MRRGEERRDKRRTRLWRGRRRRGGGARRASCPGRSGSRIAPRSWAPPGAASRTPGRSTCTADTPHTGHVLYCTVRAHNCTCTQFKGFFYGKRRCLSLSLSYLHVRYTVIFIQSSSQCQASHTRGGKEGSHMAAKAGTWKRDSTTLTAWIR